MRLALIQQSASENPKLNMTRGLEALKEAAGSGAELVIFPELAFTRFFPQHRLQGDRFAMAESIPGPTTEAFSAVAAQLGVVVVLNLYEKSGDCAYDSSPVIDADGTILGTTRMVHITQYEGFYEQDYYDPGDTGAPVYETAVGRIGVAICYDRHYPEYLRALALGGADLTVIPQAGAAGEWPAGVFEAELQAAAFQNGYYVALANRVGEEDVLTFAGGSVIVDPMGQIISRAPEGEDHILYADLDLELTATSPARRLFLRDRRPGIYSDGMIGRPSIQR
jgi:N-carbamoylputrescine amidase